MHYAAAVIILFSIDRKTWKVNMHLSNITLNLYLRIYMVGIEKIKELFENISPVY